MNTIRWIFYLVVLAGTTLAARANNDASRAGTARRPLQGGSIEFSTGSVTNLDGHNGCVASMGLRAYDGAPLHGMQWTVINTAGKLRLVDAEIGPALAGNPDWVLSSSIHHGSLLPDLGSNDTLSIVLLSINGASLGPGAYDSLILFRYNVVDLHGMFLDSTSMIVKNVIGSLGDGSDALLTAGSPLRVLIQNTVQKGDADGNDAVDISDLVATIDHILGRKGFNEAERQRADIAPWPGGDSNINVRDLVLTQNVILTDMYPDGTPLHAMGPQRAESFSPNGTNAPQAPDVKLTIYISSSGIVVHMESGVLVKGVQLELNNVVAVPDTLRIRSSFGSGSHGLSSNILRILMFSDAGLPLDPGDRYLSWMMFDIAKPFNINLHKVVVADIANKAITNMQVSIVYGSPNAVHRLPLPEGVALEPGSPAPFSTQTAIAFTLPAPEAVEVAVHSMTGSRVRTLTTGIHDGGRHVLLWDGRNDGGLRLPAGLYFYTLSSARYRVTQRIHYLP
jgi:hypothetical protein